MVVAMIRTLSVWERGFVVAMINACAEVSRGMLDMQKIFFDSLSLVSVYD